MPTDETLRGIREDAEDEFDIDFDHIRRDQCTLIQRQTWDAGYAAGIEAALRVLWEEAGSPQACERAAERLDALKAVDRG